MGKGVSLFEMTRLSEVKSKRYRRLGKSIRNFEIKSTKLDELHFKQTHQQLDLRPHYFMCTNAKQIKIKKIFNGRILSHVRPFYECAVSDLDP